MLKNVEKHNEYITRLNKLKFRSLLIILFFISSSGVILFQRIQQETIRDIIQSHEEKLIKATNLFTVELGFTENIIRLLYNRVNFEYKNEQSNKKNWNETLENIFLRFGNSVEHISQIRWLDSTGKERVRVNIDRERNTQLVNPNELQDKSDRYYFQQGIKSSYPHIYYSPTDLNIEYQKIVYPYQPTVRISIRTENKEGLPNGLLVINYDLSMIFFRLHELQDPKYSLHIANQEGFWFINPIKEQEWGSDLQHLEYNANIQEPTWWKLLKARNTLAGYQANNAIYSSTTIMANNHADLKRDVTPRTLYFWIKTPYNFLDSITEEFILQLVSASFIITLIGVWLTSREIKNRKKEMKLMFQLRKEKQELNILNKKLNQTLNEQNLLQNELIESKRLSSLGMVVAGVAHEINTPTGGALVVVSTLQKKLDSLNTKIENGLSKNDLFEFIHTTENGLALAKNNLDRISLLVTSFKRLAVDRAIEQPVTFQMEMVINDLFILLKTQMSKTRISLQKDIQPNLTLYGYPGIVSQIIQNLIVNAAKHAFEHSDVGQILVTAQTDNHDMVILRVSDNGTGIPESIRQTLFDPFVTTARNKGSTGLGLHLVHQWVTQILHGKIRFRSQTGSGTEFIIIFKKNLITPDTQETEMPSPSSDEA